MTKVASAQRIDANGREVMTSADFAEKYGWEQYNVNRAIQGRKLEGVKIGREYVVFKDSIEEFLRSYVPTADDNGRVRLKRIDVVSKELELGLIDPLRMELTASHG